MKNLLSYLDRVAVSSLPEGDVDMLHGNHFNVVGLKGHSIKRPWYHQDLISNPEFKGKLLLLPDVGKFEIELKPFDPALLANGICRRYPSEITIYKNRNRRINRYLVYVQWRMQELKGNQHAYWCFTQTLIRKSHSYLVACMHSVDKNLYRKKSLKEIRMLLLRLNRMRGQFVTANLTQFGRQRLTTNHGNEDITVSLMQHYLKFFRIYIPKGTDSFRPLGVPTLAWRIFQKMWLPPLLIFTQDHFPSNFHGYIPKKGTGTAWHEILKSVIHYDNIYEVDFKQFFPSVDSDFLLRFMLNCWNISLPVACYLYQLNQSRPIFLESKSHDLIHGEVRFTPSHQVSLIENQLKILGNNYSKDQLKIIKGLSLEGLEDMDAYFSESELLRDYSQPMQPLVVKENIFSEGNMLSYSPGNTKAWIEAQRVTPRDPNKSLREELGFNFKGSVGLPQGGTLSPYLSALYLGEVLTHLEMPEDVKYIFYADDGLFYSNNYDSLNNWLQTVKGNSDYSFKYFNITVHEEKSAWVKVKGVWLKSIKFLGLLLVPGKTIADFKLLAATKKGSNLEFDDSMREAVHFEYARSLVMDPRAQTIKTRLSALAKLEPNRITATMIGYYEALLELHSSGLSPALFAYGYYLQKIFSSVSSFSYGILHSMETLHRVSSVFEDYIKAISLPESEGKFSEVEINWDGGSAKEMFGSWLEHLNQILYNKSLVVKHESVSSELIANSHSLARATSPLYLYKESSSSLISTYMSYLSAWLTPYIDVLSVQKSLLRRGEDVDPHPYIFFNTLLSPFKFLTRKIDSRLDTNIQFIPDPKAKSPSGMAHPLGLLYNSPFEISFRTLYYFMRKYQFVNLVNSRNFGLLMSRLYIGSKLVSVEQDFGLSYVADSLASHLHDLSVQSGIPLSVFTSSSYATHELVRMSSYLGLQSKFEASFTGVFPRSDKPFRLLSSGLLPANSW